VASDDAGNTDPCAFNVTVAQALVANDDTLGTLENHSVTVLADKLMANDTASAGGTLALTDVSTNSANGGTVALLDGVITYTPAAGYTGADLFTYTITDGSSSTNGSVFVTVVNEADPAANLIGDIVVDEQGAHLVFAGIPGFAYAIQRSSDGATWGTIGDPVLAPESGLMEFVDSAPLPGPVYYYRTVAP